MSTPKVDETPDHDLAPHQVRLRRYAPAHARALAMADYLDTIDPNAHKFDGKDRSHWPTELRRCGSLLEFDVYPHREASLLSAAWFCGRHLVCPFCAIRRSARSLQDNAPRVTKALDDARTVCPHATLHLLTLTIRNGPDLLERFTHLTTAWRRLMNRRKSYIDWAKGGRLGRARRYTTAAEFMGGAYSIEIKRGARSGDWHPHLHAAVIVADAPDLDRLRAEWFELTGDSDQVDLRPFRSFVDTDTPSDESIAEDLVEVLKYALKFNAITLEDNWHAALVLAGRRLRSKFGGRGPGSMWGLSLEPDELIDYADQFADEPFVRIAATWAGCGYEVHEGEVSHAL